MSLANSIKLLALSPASGHTKQVMDVKGRRSLFGKSRDVVPGEVIWPVNIQLLVG